MTNIYEFKVELAELPKKIWRKIELTSETNVATLGYAILAAFECNASHLFYINFNENRYEIIFDDSFVIEPTIDPVKTKLSELNLSVGDVLEMEYDYGASWEFTIKLTSITEMQPDAAARYPYVTAGRGKGIIEDTSPYELADIIEETNRTGKFPMYYDYNCDKEVEWNYKDFDLNYCNELLKDNISEIQFAYEQSE